MEPTGRGPSATVVVATRNRADDAQRAVSSVLSGGGDIEVIVVDQSDEDATELALAAPREDPRLRYIRTDVAGKTRAMNLALRAATTPLVLFTDDDCEVPANWVEVMSEVLTANERTGAVFCQIVAGPHDEGAGFVPTFLLDGETTWTSTWRLATPEMGAGMAVRRTAVDEVGGFDEQMGPGGRYPSADDVDIANRLLAGGWHVIDTDRTEVVHHGFRTFEQGRELTRRDWIAIGASFGKAARCGLWGATVNGLYLGVWLGIVSPFVDGVRDRRRPRGLGRVVHFGQGFASALFAPVDRRRVLFR